jgi:dihydropyrimidinase
MSRLIISGGTLVTAENTFRADLIIEGETITGIIEQAQPDPDDQLLDASGMLVFPGVVDAHTHIQLDTGLYQTADNWEIGTKAAAAGGVTTVIDFANPIKGQPFKTALEARLAEARDAIIDYNFHMVVLEPAYEDADLRAELGAILDLGMNSIKLFTTYRPNYYMDDAALFRIFKAMPPGLIAMVHAENDAIVTDATQRLVKAGKTGWGYHAQGRPREAEIEADNRLALLANLTESPLFVAHTTTPQGVDLLANARESSGLPIFCETCIQYLLLDDTLYAGAHPERYILQPPLRGPLDREALWSRLMTGEIVSVSTDSCDYSLGQKQAHRDFTQTPGGLPGLETLLSLLFTYGVEAGRIGLTDLARLISTNPAKIFGLYPRKGSLTIGADADLVIYDPEPEKAIHHTDLHYVAGYSPYEGMRVRGEVKITLSRGEIIYQEGAFPAKVGRGKFVEAAPFDPTIDL